MEIIDFKGKIKEFLETLDPRTSADCADTIAMLESYGHHLRMPFSKKIVDRIFELRINRKVNVRIFYIFHNGTAILLHGFVKKSHGIPSQEIRTGLARLRHVGV